ncbi:MAG: hypothetical protein ABR563_12605 [Pyrinomonadaceae bacterium]
MAQQNCAALTSGVSCRARAFTQQSTPSFIIGMAHSCSPECNGTPAAALPPSTASMNKDVSHFATAKPILFARPEESQAEVPAARRRRLKDRTV